MKSPRIVPASEVSGSVPPVIFLARATACMPCNAMAITGPADKNFLSTPSTNSPCSIGSSILDLIPLSPEQFFRSSHSNL